MTDATSPKESETTAIEAKKDDDKVEHIILHQARDDFNDIVLVCKGKEEGKFVHFYLERAVLASVSSPFSNILADCKNEKEGGKHKIPLNEDAKTVETFLNILYGKSYLALYHSFHHMFMVLEMGDKYCAPFIVDRMIFQLCETLRVYIEEQKPFNSRYSNAVILKYLSLCRKINNKQVLASPLAFNTLKSTILRHWHQYLKKCGAKFSGKCACSCGNCTCVSKYCSQNRFFDIILSRLSVDMFFPNQSSTEYFSALDLLLFTNALNTYLLNGGHAGEALVEFLSPQSKNESSIATTVQLASVVHVTPA